MSEQTQGQHLAELLLQAAIDDHTGELVELGNGIIDMVMSKDRGVDLSTQLRNALAVANAAPHPLVLTSFIGYQIGRQTTQKAWKSTGLGEKLINTIEVDVAQLAAKAAQAAGKSDVAHVQMRMARLLLGFMSRHYVYEADKLKGTAKQEGRR